MQRWYSGRSAAEEFVCTHASLASVISVHFFFPCGATPLSVDDDDGDETKWLRQHHKAKTLLANPVESPRPRAWCNVNSFMVFYYLRVKLCVCLFACVFLVFRFVHCALHWWLSESYAEFVFVKCMLIYAYVIIINKIATVRHTFSIRMKKTLNIWLRVESK